MAVQINAGSILRTVVFSAAHGEYLVSGDNTGVRVWRAKDGKEIATIAANKVTCAAVSADMLIGVGTLCGEVFVWNAEHEQIFQHDLEDRKTINGVDFSSDATRLVVASANGTASVWDITTSKQFLTIHRDEELLTAKYSPHGEKIAIATKDSVQVYASDHGSHLLDIKVNVSASFNNGLLWFDNHLFVVSGNKIKQFHAFTGSMVSEWPVPDSNISSAISLPNNGKFIAYATGRTVTLWDTSTHIQSSFTIRHPQDIWSIAISRDDRFLAVGGKDGSVVIENLYRVNVGVVFRIAPFTGSVVYTAEPGQQVEYIPDSSQHSFKELEYLGDQARDAHQHDEAISHYTTVLSLNPPAPQLILIKRSSEFLQTETWEQALNDANEAIRLDPSSPWGYQTKHAALHKAGDYVGAIQAFETMLSKMERSPDPDVQQYGNQYIRPSATQASIRNILLRATRHLPRVLINTSTGRLHDQTQQASAFESQPIFYELVSSMTTRIDYIRITREVRRYFRYATLSHKLEANEPQFQQVSCISVYDLDMSPTNHKLQVFCKIVRDAGFSWAWSSTCCVNTSDHVALQEAHMATFKWYRNSALVVVFLIGVRSPSRFGDLMKSIWNSHAWTLQEYIAAKVVHFYTQDWKPYLNLEFSNHKESQEVISKMEQATGISADQLTSLRPGLTSIREKLRLASTRQATLVEDVAYSLLGIFSVTDLPIIYSEGNDSLGRLLAQVLTRSGDASILAWTGTPGTFNSCLPTNITVFNGPATSHVPLPTPDAKIEVNPASSFDLDVAMNLYDRLEGLPPPWFASSQLKLPCISFELPRLSVHRTRYGHIYRADTSIFGMVEIETRQDLSHVDSLYLIHPWLDGLLEHRAKIGGALRENVATPSSPDSDDEGIFDEDIDEDKEIPEPELTSHATPEPAARETRARRFVARLK